MLDGDEAGRKAVENIAVRLARKLWVRVADVPEGRQPGQFPAEELQGLLAAL
jgi:DNA primase